MMAARNIFSRPSIAGIKPNIVFDSYWRFAAERQAVFFRRLESASGPWSTDPVIAQYKFTNAYRASDRVSQYLIRNVIYRGERSVEEMFFRIVLFKLFNRIETWELLTRSLGEVRYSDYSFSRFSRVLSKAKQFGQKIYSAAYIMPSGKSSFGFCEKHKNNLRLIELLMREDVPQRIVDSRSMKDAYEILRSYPTLGKFLGYQFITDINYSNLTSFDEMEFVVPGPGAIDGVQKCFGVSQIDQVSDVIKMVADNQEYEFSRRGLNFKSLWGRRLQLIDCQNLFCELAKYARITHPQFPGVTGRTRIKQQFSPNAEKFDLFFPPKWGLNEKIGKAFQFKQGGASSLPREVFQ